ncbi:MAG: hypothetical protein RLZZ303_1912 [Candidatus Hydrogenedentota bacterium]|jgi:hypothetical protein
MCITYVERAIKLLVLFLLSVVCGRAAAFEREKIPIILFGDSTPLSGILMEIDLDSTLRGKNPLLDQDCLSHPVLRSLKPLLETLASPGNTSTEALAAVSLNEIETKHHEAFLTRFRQQFPDLESIEVGIITRIGEWLRVSFLVSGKSPDTSHFGFALKCGNESSCKVDFSQGPQEPLTFLWADLSSNYSRRLTAPLKEPEGNFYSLPLCFDQAADQENCAELLLSVKKVSKESSDFSELIADYGAYRAALKDALGANEFTSAELESLTKQMESTLAARIKKKVANLSKINKIKYFLNSNFSKLIEYDTIAAILGDGDKFYCLLRDSSDDVSTQAYVLPVTRSEGGYKFGGGGYGLGDRGDEISLVLNHNSGSLSNRLLKELL